MMLLMLLWNMLSNYIKRVSLSFTTNNISFSLLVMIRHM